MVRIRIPELFAARPDTVAARLNRWQGYNLALVLVASLALLFISLHFALENLWQRAARSIQVETERQADTIARLLVFEFSHLQDLRLAAAGVTDQAVDGAIQRRLWEKVTFNEAIRGLELIAANPDAEGRYLTYSFYNLPARPDAAGAGPQKAWQSFSGPERTLINLIHREQRVDLGLVEAINRGTKIEGELLLRYLPLYLPQPEKGALYWGVVKVGISSEALRRFYVLLDEERLFLRRLLTAMALISAVSALFLGLAGSNWLNRHLTLPIRRQAELEARLSAAPGVDLESLRYHLSQLPTQEIVEYERVKAGYLRLVDLGRELGRSLVTLAPEACLGRWQQRLATVLPASHPTWNLWLELTSVPDQPWANLELGPWLAKIRTLLAAALPSGVQLAVSESPVPPVAGKLRDLLQAFLLLGAFALQEVDADGVCSWRTETSPTDGLRLKLDFPGRSYQEEECRRWLALNQGEMPCQWTLALAAALARQHGGRLEVSPRPGGGLQLLFQLPAARIEADDSQGANIN